MFGKLTLDESMNTWHKGNGCLLDAWREVQERWMSPYHWNKPYGEEWWVTAVVWRKEGMYLEGRWKGERGGKETGVKEMPWKVKEKKQEAVLWILHMLFVALGATFVTPIDLIIDVHLSLIFQHQLIIISPSNFNWCITLAPPLTGFTSLELGQFLNK